MLRNLEMISKALMSMESFRFKISWNDRTKKHAGARWRIKSIWKEKSKEMEIFLFNNGLSI
jgi:hypothetical protein